MFSSILALFFLPKKPKLILHYIQLFEENKQKLLITKINSRKLEEVKNTENTKLFPAGSSKNKVSYRWLRTVKIDMN